MGIRIDAPFMIPRDVHQTLLEYAEKICSKNHHTKLFIIAETLGSNLETAKQDVENLKGCVTHAFNSVCWMKGPDIVNDEKGYGTESLQIAGLMITIGGLNKKALFNNWHPP